MEIYECRRCDAEVRTSDKAEIASQLCNSCFDIRAQYRKDNPGLTDEIAEINWLGDKFGRKRSGRKFICACCSAEYAVVPLGFYDLTENEIAEARASFDKMAPLRENSGKSHIKFKFEAFDYTNAPKGWTNEILCQSCFENLPQAFSHEFEQAAQAMKIKQEQMPTCESTNQEEKREEQSLAKITSENPIGSIAFVIFLAASVMALFRFISAGATDGWNAASKASPYGEVLIFIILGFTYLAVIPWLHDKGGGCREASNVMSWIAGIAFVLFVISIMPSCDSDRGFNGQGEMPYYRK